VQVDDAGAAGAFVQVVDVLRDQREAVARGLEGVRERGERAVRGVGLDGAQLRAPLLIEAPHQPRIALPTVGRRDVLDAMAFPQAAGVAERAHAGVGADAGPGQHEHVVVHHRNMGTRPRWLRHAPVSRRAPS